MTTKIKPNKVLFIKLGEGGKFEKDCIENDNTLRIGYKEIDHNECLNGNWDAVHKYFTDIMHSQNFVATSHTNQIKQFYEESENTLWITFYANKLWWCFSKPEITILPDQTKTRPVIGKWSDTDLKGKILTTDSISGKLSKVQGFRGTICKVLEESYALSKINAEQLPAVIKVEKSLTDLKNSLGDLIQSLQWKDFETLIDLIFREAGWQRVGAVGKTQKTLDLDLMAPVTGERAMVQIKSESDLKEYKHYLNEFANHNDYDKFFYIVHSPASNLANYSDETEGVNLYFNAKITELAINSGLVEWIIKKTS